MAGVRLAPQGIESAIRPSMPLELVTGLITEKGVFQPPLVPTI
jgi:methylthioribose-1-phosphate isomerase